jgi:flagellar assembly protein FliH
MKKRTLDKFSIQEESRIDRVKGDRNIINFDQVSRTEIREFVFAPIQGSTQNSYAEIKKQLESSPSGEPNGPARARSDRQFSVNPLLKKSLSIQEEENRLIDQKVQAIVSEITEQVKSTAAAAGYEEGLKKGFEEANARTKAESQSKIERFDAFLDEMEAARAQIYKINERVIIEMIVKISEMLVLRELATDRDYILRVSKELVDKVGTRENITLRVNPDEGEVIGILKDGLKNAFGDIKNFNVEISSRVKQGGCEIETEWNLISSNINEQIMEVHRSLIPEDDIQSTPDSQEDGPS